MGPNGIHASAPEDALPMIVGLHYMTGSPETSRDDHGGLDFPARLILPAGPYPADGGHSWFPDGYYEWDESRQAKTTLAMADQLADFITRVVALRPTVGKPIVTGYSQGGDLSYVLALHHPELIRAALPMGARLPAAWRPDRLSIPVEDAPSVFVFHGREDPIVSVAGAREAAAYLEGLGISVELHEYADTGHAYPESMRSDYRRIAADLLEH
jgi:phospholipase/carboxylesterase